MKVPPEVKLRAVPMFRHAGRLLGADERQVGGANPKETLVLSRKDAPDLCFIAKRPRRWPRECVTEAILGTIAKTLPMSVARFRLVRLPSKTRANDIRFMSEVFLGPQEALVHGVEIAARWLETDPDEMLDVFELANKVQEREFYTIEVIVEMLNWVARSKEERLRLLTDFGKMVVFDAFVGVQDRHAQNWGLIECTTDPQRPLRFAPLYDTARGLFVSHGEEKLAEISSSPKRHEEIVKYAEGSKPIFGCRAVPDVNSVNHFRLVEHLVTTMPVPFRSCARNIVGRISLNEINKQLRIKYARMVSPVRLNLIGELLSYRHGRMRQIAFSQGEP